MSSRADDGFALELANMIPEALKPAPTTGKNAQDVTLRQSALLRSGLRAAFRCGSREAVAKLVGLFAELVRESPPHVRLSLVSHVGGDCVLCLAAFAMRAEVQELVTEISDTLFHGAAVAELRAQHAVQPETWAAVLRSLMHVAGGWLWLGAAERADPVLAAGRRELLGPDSVRFRSNDYMEVARAYVPALGGGPPSGLELISALFSEMPLRAITNTWQTALYFSRSHLQLVEDAVLAVCRLGIEQPAFAGA